MRYSSKPKSIRIKFSLGELNLRDWRPELIVIEPSDSINETMQLPSPDELVEKLTKDADGFLARRVANDGCYEGISKKGQFLLYAQPTTQHFLVELHSSFDEYISKFSPKTRQNITRSVRKLETNNPNEEIFHKFRTPDEIKFFITEAIKISNQTYQARLLKSGIPSTTKFIDSATDLAAKGNARGYLLKSNGKFIAFAWCRIEGARQIYDVIGYLPEHGKHSPGTVLLYLIIKSIFMEGRISIFDFGPGYSSYKEIFSNCHIHYKDILVVRDKLTNKIILETHRACETLSKTTGDLLFQIGIKEKIKRILRKV